MTVGKRLFWGTLSLFLIFAVLFIVFQQNREKQFKIDMLNLHLQDYNYRLADMIETCSNTDGSINGEMVDKYVKKHYIRDLRVTFINIDGKVIYDNRRKDYDNFSNHHDRKEVVEALKTGKGFDISRESNTVGGDFFYSETLLKDRNILIAQRSDHVEILEREDLAQFPDDELGEISESIIKIYKRLQKTKEEQNELKRQLTQNVAHELKTPVASIQGYLETIMENPNIDNDKRSLFLERCYAQSKRLTSLLRDISTLNRLDDATGLIEFEDVDVTSVIRQIAKEISLQMEERGMTLKTNLPEKIVVKGAQGMIYSIFRNLTDNAIAYAGNNTQVTITAERTSSAEWHFTFCDNGVGVEQKHLDRLFERFYRVDKGRSRKMGGTGLGLAIVKNAVLLHGGTIKVGNRPTGGLQFDFTLA